MADVVLFGATGYTGRLTAHALDARGLKFALAGRNRDKLEALARSCGDPPVHVASVGAVDELCAALDGASVLISCVGPFMQMGDTAVEAALGSGVHYVDSTGEGLFIERLIEEHDEAARKKGIVLAPAMGFDEVPADVISTMATAGMERPELTLTYAVPSTGSAGTVRSALDIITGRGRWIRNGAPRSVKLGEVDRWSPMPPPLGPKRAVSAPLASGWVVPLHLELDRLEIYLSSSEVRRVLGKLGIPLLRLGRTLPPVRSLMDRIVDRLPEGPDERGRKARWTILAEATADRGTSWRNVSAMGEDVYGLTAHTLAAAADKLARGTDLSGVRSPVEVLGLDRLRTEIEDFGVEVIEYEIAGTD